MVRLFLAGGAQRDVNAIGVGHQVVLYPGSFYPPCRNVRFGGVTHQFGGVALLAPQSRPTLRDVGPGAAAKSGAPAEYQPRQDLSVGS